MSCGGSKHENANAACISQTVKDLNTVLNEEGVGVQVTTKEAATVFHQIVAQAKTQAGLHPGTRNPLAQQEIEAEARRTLPRELEALARRKAATTDATANPAPPRLERADDDPYPGWVTILAHHPEHGQIGFMELSPAENGGREVYMVEVEEDFQRQGIATSMWEMAVEQGLSPKHSTGQTDEGKSWAESLTET